MYEKRERELADLFALRKRGLRRAQQNTFETRLIKQSIQKETRNASCLVDIIVLVLVLVLVLLLVLVFILVHSLSGRAQPVALCWLVLVLVLVLVPILAKVRPM